MSKISLIVPAHNEEKRIEDTIINFQKLLSEYKDYEIIFVCNNCTDSTIDLIKQHKEKNNKIKILEYSGIKGKGYAVVSGLKKADGDILGFLDADDAFEHKYIHKIISKFENEHYDCVIASKWKNQGFKDVNESFQRKLLAIGWNLLSKVLLDLNYTDTQAGAKFLRKKAFNKINKNFTCNGFDFDVEVLFKLKQANQKITEIFVPTKERRFSTFHYKYVPGMAWRIIKLFTKRINKLPYLTIKSRMSTSK